jgi:hypothetical protein
MNKGAHFKQTCLMEVKTGNKEDNNKGRLQSQHND